MNETTTAPVTETHEAPAAAPAAETHGAHGAAAEVVELPKEPELTKDGLKIYPTSFLPVKSKIETSRIPTARLSGFEIEVTHVVIFLILTVGLFYSMWMRPNKR